jgi:hypothetical protein
MSYSGGLGGGHHGGGGGGGRHGGGGGGHGGGGGGGHHGGGGGHRGGGRHRGGGFSPSYGPGYIYDVVDEGPYVVLEDASDWTVYVVKNNVRTPYPGAEHLSQDAARQIAQGLIARGIDATVEGR